MLFGFATPLRKQSDATPSPHPPKGGGGGWGLRRDGRGGVSLRLSQLLASF